MEDEYAKPDKGLKSRWEISKMIIEGRTRKNAGRALLQIIVFITACTLLTVLAGCGQNTGSEESLTFENEGQTYQIQTKEKVTDSTAEFDKEESVQVEADGAGNVKKITVETRLKHGNANSIEDLSTLENIRNTEGDEEYKQSADGRLVWENHGEDIYYEGITTAELPVGLKISYELDGQVIDPKQLAGKSGKLRMRFDYENRSKQSIMVGEKEEEISVPFVAISMVVLPEDVFSDVKVENGKLVSMGDDRIAVGYVFPGLADSLKLQEMEDFDDIEIPDYVEITAQVTDFELDFTATVITPGMLEDMESEDLNDIDDLIDDMHELRDAANELVDGTKELADGVDEFGDYLQEYVDAIAVVKEGTAGIQQGVGALKKNSKTLLEGAQGLQSGLEALQQAISGAGSGGLANSSGTGDLSALMTDMNARLAKLEKNVDSSNTEAQQEIEGLKADIATLNSYMAAMEQASGGSAELAASVKALAEGSAQLTAGIQAFGDGIGKLYKGSEKLNSGVGELKDVGKELTDGYGELVDGVGEFRDGVKEFDEEGIQKLTDMADGDLQNLVDRMRALKEADKGYTNFGGILPGKSGSVRFVIETEEIKK